MDVIALSTRNSLPRIEYSQLVHFLRLKWKGLPAKKALRSFFQRMHKQPEETTNRVPHNINP